MKNKNNVDYTLYLCTDRGLMTTDTVEESVRLAVVGGCGVVQLREKEISSAEFYRLAVNTNKITDEAGAALIINDRVDIALAADADGVHVGQSDLPATVVRQLIGPDKLLGVSVATLEQAKQAAADGADYLGVGAMYATQTKTDADIVTMEELRRIRAAVNIPIVVIGGINKNTLGNFKEMGIDGLAVVSAVVAQADITAAAKELIQLFKE